MPSRTEQQLEILRAVCDTIVPSVDHVPDPHGFWARSATDAGADLGIMQTLATLPEADAGGLLQLLDALGEQGFVAASAASREQLLRTLSLASSHAAAGIAALRNLTLFMVYAGLDPATGQNPNFATFGYQAPPPLDASESPSTHADRWIEG